MFKRNKQVKPLYTEGLQEDAQQISLRIQSKIEALEKVEKLVGKYGDLKIQQEIEKTRQEIIEDIKNVQSLGVSLFDVLSKWGSQLFESNIIKAKQNISENQKIAGESKLADFVPEDKLIVDQIKLAGMQELRRNTGKLPFHAGISQEMLKAAKLDNDERNEIHDQMRQTKTKETALQGLFQRLDLEYQQKDEIARRQKEHIKDQIDTKAQEISDIKKEIPKTYDSHERAQKREQIEEDKEEIQKAKEEIQQISRVQAEAKEEVKQQIGQLKEEINNQTKQVTDELKGLEQTRKQFEDKIRTKIAIDPTFNFSQQLDDFKHKYSKYPRLKTMFDEIRTQLIKEHSKRLMPEEESEIDPVDRQMRSQMYERSQPLQEEYKSFNDLPNWGTKTDEEVQNARRKLITKNLIAHTTNDAFKGYLKDNPVIAKGLFAIAFPKKKKQQAARAEFA